MPAEPACSEAVLRSPKSPPSRPAPVDVNANSKMQSRASADPTCPLTEDSGSAEANGSEAPSRGSNGGPGASAAQDDASSHRAVESSKVQVAAANRSAVFEAGRSQGQGVSEPVPGTSRDTSGGVGVGEDPTAGRDGVPGRDRPSSQSLRNQRKSLPLIPRVNQYERHPLLQTKYGGLSEFEMFVLDREQGGARRSSARSFDRDADLEGEERLAEGLTGDRRLIPRSAHSEPHPLLQRSDSGLCAIEQFLMEKENQISYDPSKSSSAGGASKPLQSGGKVLVRRSTLGKLEPRSSQWQRHELLEQRDASGLSEVEKLLQEKHAELVEKGKCCSDKTCKNIQCPNCKSTKIPPTATASDGGGSTPGAPAGQAGGEIDSEITSRAPATSLVSKRVHFDEDLAADNLAVGEDDVLVEVVGSGTKSGTSKGEEDAKGSTTVGGRGAQESDRNSKGGDPRAGGEKKGRRTSARKSCCLS